MNENDAFDPLQKWFHIPAEDLPPDHYCLLGLKRFETDETVIHDAVEARLRLVQTYNRGAHAKYCRSVIYRINVAKAGLLNPLLKGTYDRKLREEVDAKANAARQEQEAKSPPAEEDLELAPLSDERAAAKSDERAAAGVDTIAMNAALAGDLPSLDVDELVSFDDLCDLSNLLDGVTDDALLQDIPGFDSGPSPAVSPSAANGKPAVDREAASGPADAASSRGAKPAAKEAQAKPTVAKSAASGTVASKTAAAKPAANEAQARPKATAGRSSSVADETAPLAGPAVRGGEGGRPAAVERKLGPSQSPAPSSGSAATATASEAPKKPALAARRSAPARTTKPMAATAPAALNRTVAGPSPAAAAAGFEVLPALQTANVPETGFELLATNETAAVPETGYELIPAAKASATATAVLRRFRPSWTAIGAATVGGIVIAAGIFFGLSYLGGGTTPSSSAGARTRPQASPPQTPPPVSPPQAVAAGSVPEVKAAPPVAPSTIELGIAYGTEKRTWLEWAVKEFANSEDGARIHVNLIPLGSIEGARAIVDGDKSIDVWSPASKLYKERFLLDWDARYKGDPIVKEEVLAVTPMVIVMWKNRYNEFVKNTPVTIKSIGSAMHARTGWGRIAGKPEWGNFKFGHTHPEQSNSGLVTLILMAYDFHEKSAGLTGGDIASPEFQDFLLRFEHGVSGLSNSTGNMMREMVLKGPSGYDALLVYESVAIDYLKSAAGRWEQLQVIYPRYNLWNDNPYYILNTPWSTPARQKAAETFLKFLMSERVQAKALDHGFRPGDANVSIKGPQSPFVLYKDNGLQIDVSAGFCEIPSAEIIENLVQTWSQNVLPH